ncbi:SDR family NAD(P)-dependent oxidoreductase [Pelagibius sp. Alg239-R121]|uniref:SDR family NAD(P)-dependent oxidoreductase n=1 Tax=Pelagibius sp. Alg239-R121 TaxID=2993448 RepID=UPI0024A62EE1|nr:SDR family NAD(P)-dependent oxidoreductase [Pelagibius sp. Alg239-R121]
MPDVSYGFEGRVAVVTGGANGIGAAIARKLHNAGATVVVWDLEEPEALGFEHDFYDVDVTDLTAIETAVAQTLSRHGRIDFLSHNAGFSGPTVPVAAYSADKWQAVIDVNLVGTFKICRAVVPVMQNQGFGRIVNMASLAGKEGTPNASAYSAAKAGVMAFTKSLGKELAGTDIRVNCIAPAAIRTAILDQMTPEHVQTMIDKSPMKRLGESDEAAELVLWLCSTACSFNSGAVFDLSGGRATY